MIGLRVAPRKAGWIEVRAWGVTSLAALGDVILAQIRAAGQGRRLTITSYDVAQHTRILCIQYNPAAVGRDQVSCNQASAHATELINARIPIMADYVAGDDGVMYKDPILAVQLDITMLHDYIVLNSSFPADRYSVSVIATSLQVLD